jgi:hypothetical protein
LCAYALGGVIRGIERRRIERGVHGLPGLVQVVRDLLCRCCQAGCFGYLLVRTSFDFFKR